MSIDTIYKSSMRKLNKAKSVGEMQRTVSEFDREFEERLKHLNAGYAKDAACMKEELDKFEARIEALRAEGEALDKEIEAVLGSVA